MLNWEKFSPEEQERAKRAIRRAIELLCSRETLPGSVLSHVVQCLADPQPEGAVLGHMLYILRHMERADNGNVPYGAVIM